MTNFFKRFAQDESGAVTVDWVVLTAAVVGLAIAIGGTIFAQVQDLAETVQGEIPTTVNTDPNGT